MNVHAREYRRRVSPALMPIVLALVGLALLGMTWDHAGAEEPRAPSVATHPPGMIASALGVTRQGEPLPTFLAPEDFDLATPKTRVLLVAGQAGDSEPSPAALQPLFWLEESPCRERYAISAAPRMNLAGQAGQAGDDARGYPPREKAYDSPTNPEAIYLWRWLGMHAPDLVVDVRPGQGDTVVWEIPDCDDAAFQTVGKLLNARPLREAGELAGALVNGAPCETGSIPALRALVPPGKEREWIAPLLAALDEAKFAGPSPARAELQRRARRAPLEVANELARVYGQDLPAVQYIPAMALVARLRLGSLTGDPRQLADVERIVAPYFSGEKQIEIRSGSDLSGHLIFTELASGAVGERRARYLELAQAAADLAFDEQGKARAAMPFHSEMSDALFMGGPILAQVGALTGDQRYRDACWRHLRFMRKLTLRDDGLYRHSPLGPTAWGRGNGFPALGLALCLAAFPANDPHYAELWKAQAAHLDTLLEHQDPTGCWRQVIDRPESYRELTATAMIGYALSKHERARTGDNERYRAALDKAWNAVNRRVGAQGRLVDVCTGTGKFPTLRDYYDRPAILGTDARGGAMALLFAVEMAEREAGQQRATAK